ncbi:MAG TPA: transposase [Bryobacteraceae bacterium]|nr:transposase [Bryobacteraceae bacterium]
MARLVLPGIPYHVTQRGNARQNIFEDSIDRSVYLDLLRKYTSEHGLAIWAWCLMTNHVHLLAVPQTLDSLPRTLGQTHRDYARYRNIRSGKSGHLWQARYYSCPVDEPGVCTVAAYIERNPVRAGLVELAEDYPWSSAAAHVTDYDAADLLDDTPWRDEYPADRWRAVLHTSADGEALGERIRRATMTGRPFGSAEFTEELEHAAHRRLRPRRPGRPKQPARNRELSILSPDFRTIYA